LKCQERIEDGEEVEMQIESDGEDEMLSRMEGEKDRAKDNNQVQDMEEDSSDEEEVSPPGELQKKDKSRDNSMQPPPLPPTPGNVVVKKGYDPKQHGKSQLHYSLDFYSSLHIAQSSTITCFRWNFH
jgi:splicing factor 3A subunit 1